MHELNYVMYDMHLKVSQDVPNYAMVAGERAELRGLNLEGLRRCGFSVSEVFLLSRFPLHPNYF